VASRMESHSEVGKIQVTAETYQLLKHNFDLVERGTIEVKGKGQMLTYWLTGKKIHLATCSLPIAVLNNT